MATPSVTATVTAANAGSPASAAIVLAVAPIGSPRSASPVSAAPHPSALIPSTPQMLAVRRH